MHPIIKPLGILLMITLLMSGLTSISTNSPGLAPDPTDDRHESKYSEWEGAFVVSKDGGISMARSSGFVGGGETDTEDDKVSITIEKSTNGSDSDTAPGLELLTGTTVEWTYEVANNGDLPLQNVVVSDNDSTVDPIYLSGDANGNGVLDSGEFWLYNATGITKEGQYSNIGNVTAYHGNTMLYAEDYSHYFGFTEPVFEASPDIDLEKHTNGHDSDTAPGLSILAGSPVEWTYYVNNTGNVNLSVPDLFDNRTSISTDPISGDDGDGVFEPGEVWVYNASGFATEGQYVNFANVTASYNNELVRDEDLSHYFGFTEPVFEASPDIDLEKHTNGHDNDTAPGLSILAGSPVEWTYYVNNTGNVNLSVPDLFDNRTSISTDPISGDDGDGVFEPGEVWVYNASGFATEGQYVNFANVTASYNNELVHDEDLSHYFGVNASIDIEKFTDGHDVDGPIGPYLLFGYPVEWTYNVTNTGNVNLTIQDVSDNRTSVSEYPINVDDNGIFEPGEVWVYNASGEVILGQYCNIGNVTASYGEFIAMDEDLSYYFGIDHSEYDVMVEGLGYWKKETNWDNWSIEEVTVGDVTYSKSAAIVNMSGNGDNNEPHTYTMFRHLVTAKLNVLIGVPYYPYDDNGTPVYFIEEADEWMVLYPLGTNNSVVGDAWDHNTSSQISGNQLKNWLEMYNEGELYIDHS
ncbi:DUF7507 domain-containing protein [Methanococcoides methylutens]|uniref:DUF7507 domain-containing protein n=1 Tax=Methanococcoides methylutens TaxID=2226 RepID=UPI001083D2D8|nr:hypothetical protein [Methanococcoides methylutens]